MKIELLQSVIPIAEKYGIPALFAGLLLLVGARQLLKLRKKAGREAQLRHKRMRAIARRTLVKIQSMVPVENPGATFAYLRKMNPYAFEEMILEMLQHRKLRIVRNEGYSGDGGIDGQFYVDRQLWLIQAKRYAKYVKKEHVWTFDAICKERGAKGLFVHTGKTPKDLLQLRRQAGVVRIISGDELMAFFAGHKVDLRTPEEIRAGGVSAAASAAAAPAIASAPPVRGAQVAIEDSTAVAVAR